MVVGGLLVLVLESVLLGFEAGFALWKVCRRRFLVDYYLAREF